MRDYNKKIIFYCYGLMTVGLGLLVVIIVIAAQPHYLNFYVFDVGQGDALLIRTPAGNNILIDGGPDKTIVEKLGQTLPFYDHTIDLLILTHPHADHITGLLEVLKRYQVKRIMRTNAPYFSPTYQSWLNLLAYEGAAIDIVDHVGTLPIEPGISLYILYPDHNIEKEKVKDANNTSMVAKLIFNQVTILLTGDYDNEETLVAKHFDLHSQILKVGHHGADNANNNLFLRSVQPQIAVVSDGRDNRYGHPNPATLKNLQQLGATVYRTDQRGDIDIVTDGKNIWVK